MSERDAQEIAFMSAHSADAVEVTPDANSGPNAVVLALMKDWKQKLEAENTALREARDARRQAEWDRLREQWRNGPEYEQQKAKLRASYAEGIWQTEGRAVRQYEPVLGTPAEQEEERRRRKRDAEAKRTTPASKDDKADRMWISRQRAKGLSEEAIADGLLRLRGKRAAKREAVSRRALKVEDVPDFGRF